MNPQPDEQIEAYLDELSAQLTQLPAAKQEEVRRETCGHLMEIVAAGETVSTALHRFGNPVKIGRQIAGKWRRDSIQDLVVRWVVRLCIVPIMLFALIVIADCFLRKADEISSDPNYYMALYMVLTYRIAVISVYLPALLIFWRAYLLKRWAWAVIAINLLFGTIVMLASQYWSPPGHAHAVVVWEDVYLAYMELSTASFGPAIVLSLVLAGNWRRLKSGV